MGSIIQTVLSNFGMELTLWTSFTRKQSSLPQLLVPLCLSFITVLASTTGPFFSPPPPPPPPPLYPHLLFTAIYYLPSFTIYPLYYYTSKRYLPSVAHISLLHTFSDTCKNFTDFLILVKISRIF